ncbi:hypothetical protein ACIBEJ_00785 [Nonomuraea sp. NPDC050790]|uniref:hypothetical protein n=1 Tax=Nonomuraea sp. NPDC050790 TaxID=3364371 RepID=UPI0037991612
MPAHPAAIRTRITLRVNAWKLVVDGLFGASYLNDGPGWCFCPDAEIDICDACGRREARAYDYRTLAEDIGRELTRDSGRQTFAVSAAECALITDALRETAHDRADNRADDVADDRAYDVADEGAPAQLLLLAARIDRRRRRSHARPLRADEIGLVRADLAERQENLASWAESFNDAMYTSKPVAAEEWAAFDALRAERDALAAAIERRPRRPHGTRARRTRRA